MNRSEELCKLLGIEIECMLSGSCNFENPCNVCMYGIYPDFEKPSNFVKLFECITEIGNIQYYHSCQGLKCALFGDTGYWERNKKGNVINLLINSLIEQLSGTYINEAKKQDMITQIQNIKWEY